MKKPQATKSQPQIAKFKAMAKQVEADGDEAALNRALVTVFAKVARPVPKTSKKSKSNV